MGGRITKKDIENYLEAGRQSPAVPLHGSTHSWSECSTCHPFNAGTHRGLTMAGTYTVIPQTPIRKAISEHMVLSEHIAPHVSTIMEVDMSCVVDHRLANKEAFAVQGVNLTFTPHILSRPRLPH